MRLRQPVDLRARDCAYDEAHPLGRMPLIWGVGRCLLAGGVSLGTSFATEWSRLKPEPRHLTRSGATPVQCRYVTQDAMASRRKRSSACASAATVSGRNLRPRCGSAFWAWGAVTRITSRCRPIERQQIRVICRLRDDSAARPGTSTPSRAKRGMLAGSSRTTVARGRRAPTCVAVGRRDSNPRPPA
jgi:hypothetical protein